MKAKIILRALLLIVSGVMLCFVFQIGIVNYQVMKHPFGSIKNSDYDLVEVANRRGEHLFDLHKGESKLLQYGTYKITVADAKVSFMLWKNNRGFCDIHSGNGLPVVETDGNCGIDSQHN